MPEDRRGTEGSCRQHTRRNRGVSQRLRESHYREVDRGSRQRRRRRRWLVRQSSQEKEKKKKSEEERKARKEKKRRLEVANGSKPMEIHADSDSSAASTPTVDTAPRPQLTPT